MSYKRSSYTSDLSDAQWEIIEALLPLIQEGRGRLLELDMRCCILQLIGRRDPDP